MAVDHLYGQKVVERESVVAGTNVPVLLPASRVLALARQQTAVPPARSKQPQQQPLPVATDQPASSPGAGTPV